MKQSKCEVYAGSILGGVFLDLLYCPSDLLARSFTTVIVPMHCWSDGHFKNSILVHPTYYKLLLGHASIGQMLHFLQVRCPFFVGQMGNFSKSNRPFLQVGWAFFQVRWAILQVGTHNLQKVLIRPTKSAHPTYKKYPSNLQKLPIRPTKKAKSIRMGLTVFC